MGIFDDEHPSNWDDPFYLRPSQLGRGNPGGWYKRNRGGIFKYLGPKAPKTGVMAYKRKRGYGWSSRKRRKRVVPVRVIGGTYRTRYRGGKRRGFYRKKAFAGRRGFTARKLGRCIESRMLQISAATNNQSFTNGAVTTTRELVAAPTQFLIQGTGLSDFTGNCIYLTGILFQCFLHAVTDSFDDYYVQIDVFKDRDDLDLSASTDFVQRTDTGTETTDHFYDRIYGATSTVTDAQNFQALPNKRGGGPPCIFRRKYVLKATAAGNNLPSRQVRIWLPFNQICRFKHQLSATGLTTAPNFFEHGDPVFCPKYYNANASAGTQAPLLISGAQWRIYFKDP